jgi:potassium-transporting ATPase potassium-binding subunit
MTLRNLFELIIFFVILSTLANYLAIFMQKVFEEKKNIFERFFLPLEKLIYKVCKINSFETQTPIQYWITLLIFSIGCFIFTFLILQLQYYLPLNPEKLKAPSIDTTFNIVTSYITNTNWQSYKPETTLSYFSQMIALTLQNFVSPAVGFCVALVLMRAFKNKASEHIGNFYKDLSKILFYVLLPLSIILSAIFVNQGVPQNFNKYKTIKTLDNNKQLIIGGPIASQEAIKILGSNGGGFTNANSSHPFENPTPLTNYLQIICIMLIPAAQFIFFARYIRNMQHGKSIYLAMLCYFFMVFIICFYFELDVNPEYKKFNIDSGYGNLEGKEVRINNFESTLYTIATTTVSNGATNCSLDSMNPISGLMPMINIQLGEIVFGGIGSGLYSMILFILLSIFLCGLIIGRTPEYLGKKIEGKDVKYIMLAFMIFILTILAFSAISINKNFGIDGIQNKGPHGLTEILYAYSSAAGNNGSAFGGLKASLPWYNWSTAIAMLIGRYGIIYFIFLLAKSVSVKKRVIEQGSVPITGLTFSFVLFGTILLIGSLTFLPAVVLGPILEKFDFLRGIFY